MLPFSPLPAPTRLDPFLSQKIRFWSLMAMVLLIYVHAYNLHPRYLQPFTLVREPLGPGTWLQYLIANGLLRFRIPILFAISGYLFAWRDGAEPHGQRVRRRLRTLGLPYLLWSGLWLAALWALEQFPVTRQAVIGAEISPFWPRQLLSQLNDGALAGALAGAARAVSTVVFAQPAGVQSSVYVAKKGPAALARRIFLGGRADVVFHGAAAAD